MIVVVVRERPVLCTWVSAFACAIGAVLVLKVL